MAKRAAPRKAPKPEPAQANVLRRLTPKQKRFVVEYGIDHNGKQAAIRAGYSERSATSTASELLTYPNVVAEIAAQDAKAQQRAAVTRETIAAALDEDRALAHEHGQIGAAVSATSWKAKLYGLVVDKNRLVGGEPDDAPIKVEGLGSGDPLEKAARIAAILATAATRRDKRKK